MNKVTIELTKDGSEFCALIGTNVMEGVAGYGSNIESALRSLADEIAAEGYTLAELLSVTVGD